MYLLPNYKTIFEIERERSVREANLLKKIRYPVSSLKGSLPENPGRYSTSDWSQEAMAEKADSKRNAAKHRLCINSLQLELNKTALFGRIMLIVKQLVSPMVPKTSYMFRWEWIFDFETLCIYVGQVRRKISSKVYEKLARSVMTQRCMRVSWLSAGWCISSSSMAPISLVLIIEWCLTHPIFFINRSRQDR